jgi:hypothetical protein
MNIEAIKSSKTKQISSTNKSINQNVNWFTVSADAA